MRDLLPCPNFRANCSFLSNALVSLGRFAPWSDFASFSQILWHPSVFLNKNTTLSLFSNALVPFERSALWNGLLLFSNALTRLGRLNPSSHKQKLPALGAREHLQRKEHAARKGLELWIDAAYRSKGA